MWKERLTVAAFVSRADAESACGELQRQGIEASVVDEPIVATQGAASAQAIQVQVPWNAFDLASRRLVAAVQDAGSDEYESRIGYRFLLGGCDYTGDAIRHVGKTRSGMQNGYEIAREEIMRYPAGLEVEIFYDPARPAAAVLQRGAKLRDGVLPCLVGLVFIAVAVAVFTGWLGMLP